MLLAKGLKRILAEALCSLMAIHDIPALMQRADTVTQAVAVADLETQYLILRAWRDARKRIKDAYIQLPTTIDEALVPGVEGEEKKL